jgi:vacuolar protein sorting-associated protein VTA1
MALPPERDSVDLQLCRQTADTFQAAATFLELVNIWGTPDAETQAKIKYAKWNAVRIVKALKEGKDPNESNPKKETESEEALPDLDPNDPEVQEFRQTTKPRQASVEEVPDEQDKIEARLARQSSIDQSLHPSAQVSARGSPSTKPAGGFEPYPRDGFPYTAVQDDNVSPLEASPNDRNGSVGGGYFPEVPTFTGESQDTTLPTAPADDALDLGLPDHPSAAPGQHPDPDFKNFSPPSVSEVSAPPSQGFDRQASPPNPPPPEVQHFGAPPVQPQQQTYQPSPQQYAPPPAPVPAPAQLRNQRLNTDDMAIAKAQKHARWAISALNFEDAETAVKELRAALQTLGAQ